MLIPKVAPDNANDYAQILRDNARLPIGNQDRILASIGGRQWVSHLKAYLFIRISFEISRRSRSMYLQDERQST